MTNTKYLQLINKAIENLRDNEDGYGQTPIEFMRKFGIKSTNNMSIFLDSVGAYLEEIRCGLLADIETAEAKKNKKSGSLSEIRKLAKECYNYNINSKPIMAYAHYDENENKYVTVSPYWILVSENSQGLLEAPEAMPANYTWTCDWKRAMPDEYDMHKVELPALSKITTYLKNKKATKSKRDNLWSRLVFPEFAINGEWLQSAMKITGATEIYVKDSIHCLLLKGNGYAMVIMPIKNYDKDNDGNKIYLPPTDFDNL